MIFSRSGCHVLKLGLTSSGTSVTLVTDSEQAVQAFVTGSSEKFDFLVRKAAPQNHEVVGGCFSKAHGGDSTPREMVSGGRLPQQETSLFASRVHAEVPDSIRRLRPNMSRFVDATFLQPQFESQGSLVSAYIGDELVSKIFVAKSIKLCFPLEIMLDSGMFPVLKVKHELGPEPVGASGGCCFSESSA